MGSGKKGEISCRDCTQIVLLKRDVSKHEDESRQLKDRLSEVSKEMGKIDRFEIILDVIKNIIHEMKKVFDENTNKLNELIMIVNREQMRTEDSLQNVERSLERVNRDITELKESLARVITQQERDALDFACKLKGSFDKTFVKALTIGLLLSAAFGGLFLLFMTLSKWIKL